MDAIYIAKTKEIIFSTRYEETKEYERNKYKLAQELKAMRMSKEWVECILLKFIIGLFVISAYIPCILKFLFK